jgi:hypothetical protein
MPKLQRIWIPILFCGLSSISHYREIELFNLIIVVDGAQFIEKGPLLWNRVNLDEIFDMLQYASQTGSSVEDRETEILVIHSKKQRSLRSYSQRVDALTSAYQTASF